MITFINKIHVFPYSDRDGTVSSNSTLKVKEEMKLVE